MQTDFRLLARLTYCGRNANYCVMRMTECPNGRLLTDTSEPCGHRLSGDEASFGALASEVTPNAMQQHALQLLDAIHV